MATTLDRGLERDEPVELKAVGVKRGPSLTRPLLYLLLIPIAIFFILPIVVVVGASLKYSSGVFTDPGLIPSEPGRENYEALPIGSAAAGRSLMNSAITAGAGTLPTRTPTAPPH